MKGTSGGSSIKLAMNPLYHAKCDWFLQRGTEEHLSTNNQKVTKIEIDIMVDQKQITPFMT
ncbi:hypothetical protein Prudu_003180 [Prunus dulcis]|uniref:Uncharacterized protein n=1 Tax=Prunus dulcis TaxID=3755 RepID=A0A4Y1QSF5_PRUDU|nr:hypothetical protein Prudu_003180 [Prunus dulcis]